ncbi:MAG: ester cyclase [Bacteroidota bacterium]
MKNPHMFLVTLSMFAVNLSHAQLDSTSMGEPTVEETNKQIAWKFYDDLWFNQRTENYAKYVADTYIVHDIEDRKNVTEPAIEQKEIADFFWENGELTCELDYQIAEGDMVATRWTAGYKPKTLLGKVILGDRPIPIINVFRIQDGKIVEIWNHRHDIDTNQTIRFTMKGFLLGLLLALIPTVWAFRLRRKLKQVS